MPFINNFKWWRSAIRLILITGFQLLGADPLGEPVPASERDEASGKRVLELLSENCVKCHGASDPKAGLRLDRLPVDFQKDADAAKSWQLVLSAIRDNEMPPAKEKQLPADDRDYLVKWIEDGLQRFIELSSADRPTLRRKLTRIEYQNTMRDLLQIEMDFARDLPADPISSDGFANDSRLLELTPVHLEAYLQCARSALRRVIVSDPRPEEFHHRFERANVSDWHGEAHITSELGRQQQFLAKILTNYPEQGEFLVRVSVEAKLQPNCGFPILEVSVGYQPDTEILFREFPVVEVSGPGDQVYEFKGRIEDFPLPVRGQGKFPGLVVRVRNIYDDGSKMPKGEKGKNKKFSYPAEPHLPVLHVKSVEFHGPIFDTWPPAHHANIITKNETDHELRRSDLRRILSKFAKRAFRRPVTNKELNSLLKFHDGIKADFPKVEDAIRETLAFVLIQPDFLFFPAAQPPRPAKASSRSVGDWELASKLSYFLWSSMPDERLFDLAEAGLLKQPKILRAEVERMLSSPKSSAFLEQFPDRWLSLDLIENVEINREFYPNFNAQLKADMIGESRAFFTEMVRSNRRIQDFLMVDFTLLNERLARHYGIPGVYGMKFRQVAIPADQHRGGLLGQAGFLLAGSTGADSHPVRRAVWIRDRLLDDPPPPPPANVPSLDSIDPKFHQLSMREKLQAHRHDPSCASCHRDLDPWGIALENYDAVGLWRTEIRTKQGDKMLTSPVIAKDSFSNGSELDGPDKLKERLACDYGDQFARSLMKRLLTYALGRSLELRDQKSIKELEKKIAADDYRMRDMIHRIVSSDLFKKHEHEQKSWHLDRRSFLRGTSLFGAGVSLGLPWLECMGAEKSAAKGAAKRFCALYFGFGVSLPKEDGADAKWRWFPKVDGADYQPSHTLEPIQPLRDKLTVLGGLSHPLGRKMGAHDTADTFLTGAYLNNKFLRNTVSADQFAAMSMRDKTRFPSLVISTDGGVGEPTRSSTLSYDTLGRPIPALNQPRQIFNRFFGAGDDDLIAENRLLLSKASMLDRILADAKSMRLRLGNQDQQKLDEYLSSVRQIEQGVERAQRWLEIPRPQLRDEERDMLRLDADDQAPLVYIRTMYDLVYLAFRTDSTRVATYQITNMADASSKAGKFPQLEGFKSSLHSLAHDYDKPGGAEALGRWDRLMVEQYCYFISRLAKAPDQDGSVLDNSVVLYGSSNSNTHNNNNYPLLLAGGANLGLKHGRYLRSEESVPLSNLLLTMLNCVGVETEKFADSTDRLSALMRA